MFERFARAYETVKSWLSSLFSKPLASSEAVSYRAGVNCKKLPEPDVHDEISRVRHIIWQLTVKDETVPKITCKLYRRSDDAFLFIHPCFTDVTITEFTGREPDYLLQPLEAGL